MLHLAGKAPTRCRPVNSALGLMALTLALIATVVVGLIWWKFDTNSRARHLSRVFSGRPTRTDEQLYRDFFTNTTSNSDLPAIARRVLAEELDADLARIEPGDDFAGNLRFLLAFDSMADVAVIEGLEKTFGIRFSADEAADLHTFGQIVSAIASKAKSNEA